MIHVRMPSLKGSSILKKLTGVRSGKRNKPSSGVGHGMSVTKSQLRKLRKSKTQ